MMQPISVPTQETLAFVQNHLDHAADLIEVGCGGGELAKALADAGHRILALDANPEAVARASALGVMARRADWPDVSAKPADAVLFTRSLHHISPLEEALDRAKTLLRPGGKLIVEDFAYLEIDQFTAAWFYHQLKLLKAADAIQLADDSFGATVLGGNGKRDAWLHDHAHDLQTGDAMAAAVRARFHDLQITKVPYLYRYVCQMVPQNEAGAAVVQSFLELETHLGRERPDSLIGRRFVASA